MDAAHIHLMLNHVPVLGSVAILCLLALADLKKDIMFAKMALQLMVLIAILTFAVYFTGEPAEEIVEHLPGVSESFVEDHENFANFAFGITELLGVLGVVGLFLNKKDPSKLKKIWRPVQLVALVNVLIIFIVANLGGQIRHTEIRKSGSAIQNTEGIQSTTPDHDD